MSVARGIIGYIALFITSVTFVGGDHPFAQEKVSAEPAKAQQLYQANCGSCHGSSRGGSSFGPPLVGAAFDYKWGKAGYDALEAFLAGNMPPASPGSLTRAEYKALTALLKPEQAPSEQRAATVAGVDTPVKKAEENYDPSRDPFDLLAAVPNKDAVYQKAVKAREGKLASISPVSDEILANPSPSDWLTSRRTYDGAGFSPLSAINRQTVGNLQVAWALALPMGSNGITPLAHDGVLFVNSGGTVIAVDATSGDELWRFSRKAESPENVLGPPITQPRGMAIFGTNIYVPTIDNHVIALNIRTGRVVWDTALAPPGSPLMITAAPVIVRGKVIQGLTHCQESGDCAVVALDAVTGMEAWRVKTIAKTGTKEGNSWGGQPPELRKGGSIWAPASYDPGTNLIYVGVSQTYQAMPLLAAKPGVDNSAFYTNSTLAIDPDTGKMKWYYQHLSRDVWDMDWAFERVIMTLPSKQGRRRVVATMGKLGILDVLDARTGRYIFSYDLGYQNLVLKIDPITGKKYTDPALDPERASKKMCPLPTGVRNWPYTSLDPRTNTLFVPYLKTCMNFSTNPGRSPDMMWNYTPYDGTERSGGGVVALNLSSQDLGWNSATRAPTLSAVLATAGGIVFSGSADRYFRVHDSSTGEILWKLRLDQSAAAVPITFEANGIQYVAVTTGPGSPLEVVTRPIMPENDPAGPGVRLWVFRIADAHSLP
jgi:alcohol dehydrogenase (cytochrome c)